jgi:Cell wall-associated hydrolases (invasion-associated proteins)
VTLVEEGYPCWWVSPTWLDRRYRVGPGNPEYWMPDTIRRLLRAVLEWIAAAAATRNHYLWGGTLGPDLDCSGLVQTAFASAGIWLPRDAYQQERFCTPVAVRSGDDRLLRPGDLIFFGTPQRCTHVAIHRGRGQYWHSSGREHGRNGIGCDSLHPSDQHPVACHYRAELRGAGRVERCHDGSTLP